MTRKIDRNKVLETMRQVVEEHGADHTARCSYVNELDQPVCIVGHVIRRLAPDYQLNRMGGVSVAGYVGGVSAKGDEPRIPLDLFTKSALVTLGVAQDVQDGTKYLVDCPADATWGTALEVATTMEGVDDVVSI